MKHLALLTVLVFIGYFGWYYMPEEVKNTVREFRKTHLFVAILMLLAILIGFNLQATFGSGKIF
jgi:predicted membrane protein